MPRVEYDKRGEVHWSALKLIGKSPAHYRAALLETEDNDTDARKRGRAVHVAALEPDRYRAEYVTWTGKVRNGGKWDDFQAANAGKEILTTSMAHDCIELQRAVRGCPAAVPYLSGGRSELTVLWSFEREAMGGLEGYVIPCRSRIDFEAKAGALVDLKSTRDASPGGFGREVARYGYHAQAAFYQDAYFAATGRRLPYVFVAVEAAQPHVAAVYRVNQRDIELGRAHYVDLMDRLHVCMRDNHWPGYGEGEMELELPAWLQPDDDENEDLTGVLNTEAA
jgi:hypothetical protein